MENKTEIITLWKELNVDRVEFEFSCGGDSMNDTSVRIFNTSQDEIENNELSNYFDDEVYREVNFYEASDGHYQGEAGVVEITLEKDGEDEYFNYVKSATAEFTEQVTNEVEVELTTEEIELIKCKILNFNGGDGDITTNYKNDCLLSDEEEGLVLSIENKIDFVVLNYVPEDVNTDDLMDWYTFTTNDEGDEMIFTDNGLIVQISNSYTEYVESND